MSLIIIPIIIVWIALLFYCYYLLKGGQMDRAWRRAIDDMKIEILNESEKNLNDGTKE